VDTAEMATPENGFAQARPLVDTRASAVPVVPSHDEAAQKPSNHLAAAAGVLLPRKIRNGQPAGPVKIAVKIVIITLRSPSPFCIEGRCR
jgi:hypothetical protein